LIADSVVAGGRREVMTHPDSLFAQLEADRERKRPPVSAWNPERVGISGMRIGSDGRWFYRESEIQRPEMVRLFSTILRRDGDSHFLVTPVERLSIEVDDAPFLVVDVEVAGRGETQRLAFRTNVDDFVEADAAHRLEMRGGATDARPYLHVRDDLEGLIARPVYYRLAELSLPGPNGRAGVWSNGVFFDLEAS
jgi:uncharacterized protein